MNEIFFIVLLAVLFLIFVTLLILKSLTNLVINIKVQKSIKIGLIIDGILIGLITIIFLIISFVSNPIT